MGAFPIGYSPYWDLAYPKPIPAEPSAVTGEPQITQEEFWSAAKDRVMAGISQPAHQLVK